MNKIPVCLASDNKLFFAVATVLVSMAENAKKDTFYEVYILISSDVTEDNKRKIKLLEKKYNNLSINYIDMGDTFVNIKKTHDYVNYVSAYKMKIPSVTKQYDKVLYIDSDVIVRSDLKELYDTEMENNYIVGVPTILNQIVCRKTIKQVINVDMDYYINAGVLLLNNKLILEDKIDKKCISMLGTFKESVDQHIFNYVCYGRIGFLPLKYNVFLSDYNLYEQIGNVFTSIDDAVSAKRNPVIMHFTAKTKPWDYYNLPFSHEWFRYYSKTGFPPRNRIELLDNSLDNNQKNYINILGVPVFKTIRKGNITKYYIFGIRFMTSKKKSV